MSLNTRFVLIDKYFKNTKENEPAVMVWTLFDGQYSVIRQVNFNDHLYFSVYIIIHPDHFEEIAKILNRITTELMARKNKSYIYKVYSYQETIPFKNTCNMWGSIGLDVFNQSHYNANIFRICCNSRGSANYLYGIFKENLHVFFGKLHIYKPQNLEIELLLANVFPTIDCQGPYITSYEQGNNKSVLVSTIYNNINIMSLHRFSLINKYIQYMVPLACVNITFNAKNEIVGGSLIANTADTNGITSGINATKETLLTLLNRIPRCAISVVLSSDLSVAVEHSPCDEIAIISIFLTRNANSDNDNDYLICHFINKKVMTCPQDSDFKVNDEELPRRIFCFCENEQLMLTKFIQHYCQNNMFVDLSGKSKANNSLHFLYGRHTVNSINAVIMDRIFHHNMYNLLYNCIGSTDNCFLLNYHAIILDIIITDSTGPVVCKTNGLRFHSNELPECLLDKLRLPLSNSERKSLSIPTEKCRPQMINVVREWQKSSTRSFVSDMEIFSRIESNSKRAMQNTNVKNVLKTSIELCNLLKFNLREINTVSTLTLASHYLFVHFLQQRIFFCSSTFNGGIPPAVIKYNGKMNNLLLLGAFGDTSHEPFNMFRQVPSVFEHAKSTGIIPILQQSCTAMELFNGLTGGWWYSKFGRFNKTCISLDFSSFYPAIVASFGLDFSNHCIMSGSELFAFASQQPDVDNANLDSMYFILDLYATPPNCQLLRMSQVKSTVNYASVYLLLCNIHTNLPWKKTLLSEMMSEALDKSLVTQDQRKVYKYIVNSTIGCFGNNRFSYYSSSLLMAIHALGQYIMSITVRFLSTRCSNLDPFEIVEAVPIDRRLLKVCTDSILWECDDNGDYLVKKTEKFLTNLLEKFKLHSRLRLRMEFKTDFVFSYTKNSLFYLHQNGKFCGAESAKYLDVIEKIYNNAPLLEKSDYRNLRLALIYMYDWAQDMYPRKNDPIVQYYKRIFEFERATRNFQFQFSAKNDSQSIVTFFLATNCERNWMIDPNTTPLNCEILNELNYLRKILVKSIQ